MAATRFLVIDGEYYLTLEIGRIADIRPCNEVVAFLEAMIDEEDPRFDGIDLDSCLVRRYSFVARPDVVHFTAGPAFQIENAVTGEVYFSQHYFEGKMYDPQNPAFPYRSRRLREISDQNPSADPEP